MQQSQKTLNPWLVSYITQNRASKNRYEIDKYLIEAGYEPAQIEATWQTVLNSNTVITDLSIPPFMWFRRVLWIINVFSIGLILVLLLFASSQVEKEAKSNFFFLTFDNITMHVFTIGFLAIALGLILWGSIYITRRIWHGSWRITLAQLALLIGFLFIPNYSYSNDQYLIGYCLIAIFATNGWAFQDYNNGIKGWGKSLALYIGLLFVSWFVYLFIALLGCAPRCGMP